MSSRRHRVLICAGVLAATTACSVPPADDRTSFSAPARDVFPAVGEVLGSNCGSLDCHGHVARNLRIYNFKGLRLEGVPGSGVTSQAEYDRSYDSVVAIDPEVLGTVVDEEGDRPERWIVISKGRGSEAHKGNVAMAPDGPADLCLISWVAGVLDEEACAAAAEVSPPEPEPEPQ
jgi:hypothetical protein